MSESRELAIRQVTLTDWQTIQSVAPAMHQSRLFGVTSAEQAMAVMLKGFELGLGLASSFEFVQVVMGKPALTPRGALALILRSPELEAMTVSPPDPKQCTVTMKRKNGFEFTCTFTIEDAKKAGLVKSGGAWEAYPANMLRWRAIGFCADVVFPDVIGGLKRADELGAPIDREGNVIEGQYVEQPTPPVAERPKVRWTLDALVSQFGADAVMEANENRIPSADDEVEQVAKKLLNGRYE